jgi:hypothetical protein
MAGNRRTKSKLVKRFAPWTEQEKALVRQKYGKWLVHEIAEKLGRPKTSVCNVAKKLGLPQISPHTRALWTAREERLLRKLWPIESYGKIYSTLRRHTPGAIRGRAQILNLSRRRSAHYEEIIKERTPRLSPTQAAYLAGLVDGEGHITISVNNRSRKTTTNGFLLVPVLGIANSCPKIVAFIKKHLPYGYWAKASVAAINKRQLVKARRPMFKMAIIGFSVAAVLPSLIPFMTSKKERAQLVLAFVRSRLRRNCTARYSAKEIQLLMRVREQNSRFGRRWSRSKEYKRLQRFLISVRRSTRS